GTPAAAASRIFNRVPPAASSGTIDTAARRQNGRVSPPSPSTRNLGSRRDESGAGGSRPRISTAASGASRRTIGQPRSWHHRTPWALGGHERSPTKKRRLSPDAFRRNS